MSGSCSIFDNLLSVPEVGNDEEAINLTVLKPLDDVSNRDDCQDSSCERSSVLVCSSSPFAARRVLFSSVTSSMDALKSKVKFKTKILIVDECKRAE